MMSYQTGQTLKGYQILERIGSGGFGAVYRAYQTTLGREVAIKVILPGYANQPEFIRRFDHEAQLVARLEHLHIVPLYDYWRDPEGAYLVMRWLRGGSLKEALANGPYALDAAAVLLDQLTSGLATAHAAGIIHRDLKPSNVLLDEEGNAYLADFGIAKKIGDGAGEESEAGQIVGSPGYLSPEQARSETVTVQTDIYSLGVTLYELLTGQHPFPNLTGVERIFKHLNDPLPQIKSLDAAVAENVNEVIQRATAKNPKYRYKDVLEMAAAFRQAAQLDEENRAALVEALTLREQEILQHIMQGKTNREIAEVLFIELSTVKWYIRQIYNKLDVNNRRQAMLKARELDLLLAAEDQTIIQGSITTSSLQPLSTNPYKGLRPFDAADARHYFGRQKLIRKLLTKLNAPSRDRFLAIVGPSGSGKSSLVHAGLIPALIRGDIEGSERWFMAQMAPGSRPLDELEVSLIRIAAYQAGNLREQLDRDQHGLVRVAKLILPQDDSELVLVIDQFEELFTLTTNEEERRHFLNILATAVNDPRSRIRVIITLRADYYDRPLHYPLFADLMRKHMETVLPLSAVELEQAIVQPAKQAGVRCEDGLVTAIIDDVLYEPGGLPLLQYALTELFEKRQGRLLTRQAYQEIGGVAGALAGRAEALFAEQDHKGQAAVRQLFLRLVALDEGQDSLPDTRRRVLRSELDAIAADEDLVDEIITSYATHRLLTLDNDAASRRPTVELAHEALLREWKRLQFWLEESRDDLYQYRRLQALTQEWLNEDRNAGLLCLQALTQEWLNEDRNAGLLLTRTRLDQLSAWAADTDLILTPDEQAYLEASLAAREDRQAAEAARQQRELEAAQQLAEAERRRAEIQTEAARRLQRRAIYLTIALVMAAPLAGAAVLANRESTRNATIASTQEALAAVQASAAMTAEANANEQRLIAENERDSAEAAATTAAVAQAAAEAAAFQRATAEAIAVNEREAAESQAQLATARELSLAALSNIEVDTELSVLLALEAVNQTYETDGFVLPEAEQALREALLNLRQEVRLPAIPITSCPPNVWCNDVAFSEDGELLVTSGENNTAVVWDTAASDDPLLVAEGHTGPILAVAISSDNSSLATASADGTAIIWALEEPLQKQASPTYILTGHTAEVTDVAFSPNGTLLATASRDDSIIIWEAATGELLTTLLGHEGTVRDVAFAADGTTLISVSSDNTARIWDIASETEQLVLVGHSGRLADLSISSDGSSVATASWDGSFKVWDTTTGEERLSFSGDSGRVYAVEYSPDGRWLAGGGTGAIITIWDAETGEEQLRLPGHKGIITNLAFTPDGQQLASGADDGTIRVWNISPSGSREWLTLDGHNWVMFGVDFSPDGSQLATASWDGQVKLWDVHSGAEITTIVADEWRQFAVEFSPDGQTLMTSAGNDSAVIWDVITGEAVHSFSGHEGPILDVALSPDSRWLVTVGESNGLIQIWNTESGQLTESWVGHDNGIERVAISPDGRLLATASVDGTAKLWLLDTVELIATLTDNEAPVNGVNFSHNGRFLATAGADNLARIWAINNMEVQLTVVLEDHSSTVWDVVFSPDDATVATISFDGSVKLWDVMTGIEHTTIPGAGNNGREVAFSPDGVFLAATTGEGFVRLYVLPIDQLLALAQSRLTRTLSDGECRQYLHLDRCE